MLIYFAEISACIYSYCLSHKLLKTVTAIFKYKRRKSHFYDSRPCLLMFYLFMTNYFRNILSQSYTFHNYLLTSVIPELGTVQTQRIIVSFSPLLVCIKIVICHTPFIYICHHFDSLLLFYIV